MKRLKLKIENYCKDNNIIIDAICNDPINKSTANVFFTVCTNERKLIDLIIDRFTFEITINLNNN